MMMTVERPGSSPLARGLPGGRGRARAPSRIIPARAGFTLPLTSRRQGSSDHPRSRGVYVEGIADETIIMGSSPLARGLPNSASIMNPYMRIIPARAGFTGDVYG